MCGIHVFLCILGTSSSVPNISCIVNGESDGGSSASIDDKCDVCLDATICGSRNRRRNTSVIIRYQHDDSLENILIDCGKVSRTTQNTCTNILIMCMQ